VEREAVIVVDEQQHDRPFGTALPRENASVNVRRHRYKTIARALALAGIASVLAGCATVGYYAHLAAGEMAVLRARVPISQLIADPHVDPALRARLALALRARAFASDT